MTPPTGSPADRLLRPVQSLQGVGPARLRQLQALGIETLGDLLELFPRTYQFESAERGIGELRSGEIQIARGTVTAVDYVAGPRPRFQATLSDESVSPPIRLSLTWFNGAYLRSRIHPGMMLRVRGKVDFFHDIARMSNPKWEKVDADAAPTGEDKFHAVYPATAKLSSEAIGKIVEEHLPEALAAVEEWFERDLLKKHRLMGRSEAYRAIHLPRDMAEAMRARRRIIYDELMLLQLGLGMSRRSRGKKIAAPVVRIDKTLDQRILRRFGFTMTGAQTRATWEIVADLKSGRPMNRLLQGDVGSGKTAVAVYGMLAAVANKLQAAILAPTEVLAEQHYLMLTNLLKDSSVNIELFTGRTKRQSRGTIMKHLAAGKVHLAVGTQALLAEDVEFANLGLVVVDEQHKLGVKQRAGLKSKGMEPHYLVMTATPIPRTLALSYFADFDVSVIDELPPGRQPIETKWVKPGGAAKAYAFVRKEVEAGRQAYVVVPMIEDTGMEEGKSVRKEFEKLSKGALAGLRLAMLHGQMRTEEKQAAMVAFRDGTIDVLVATTVIEVGIDVANATVMVIENAERFGLSQLHQLRGRVGRGSERSYCLLMGEETNDGAKARLEAMTGTSDGFEIAEMDLKLRGPGEFFGTRQHGLPEMKLADITSELTLLATAKDDAGGLLKEDPQLDQPPNRPIRLAVMRTFGEALGLAQIG